MDTHVSPDLVARSRTGGDAYVRNLAAAEAAVLRGQFNLAKVLRALAHAQRVEAMEAARLLAATRDPIDLLREILAELGPDHGSTPSATTSVPLAHDASAVRPHVQGMILRSIASLEGHSDVMERDVAQSLWGCYGCGDIVEGERPDACAVCGALAPEFEWFGPFYAATPEHLGQRQPADIAAVLARVPDIAAALVSDVDDGALSRKPSADEWSAKEILGHMLETDLLFAWRVQRILDGGASGPPLLDTQVPPWKLHEGKGYAAMPVDDIIDRLSRGRATTLDLVRGLVPAQWGRCGALRGGTVTVLDLGTWLANHDRGHLTQIQRLVGAGDVSPHDEGKPARS
jgi:rubrerythrin